MKKVLLAAGLTVAVCIAMFMMGDNKVHAVAVETVTADVREIIRTASAAGELKELRSRSLSTGGYAIVDRVYVNVGDTVQEGQVLMTYTSELSPAIDSTTTDALISAVMSTGQLPDIGTSMGNELIAPFDGIVASIGAKVGEQVTPFTSCLTVSDISRIRAVVHLDAASAALVTIGMPATVTLTGSKARYAGVVTSVSPVITTSSALSLTGSSERYCEAEIELTLPDERAISGTNVSAIISMAQSTDVVTVPFEAIMQGSDGKEFVYVVINNRAVRCNIVTGEEHPNYAEVLSGLSGGEIIVVSANAELTNGAAVEVIE